MLLHITDALQQQILIESAGIVWLFAEAIILILVRAGRRHVDSEPLPQTFFLVPRERRALAFVALAALIGFTVAPGRYFFGDPLADQFLSAAPHEVASLYHAATRPHLALWTAFVAGWVALEIAIVWQGVALYNGIRSRLHAR